MELYCGIDIGSTAIKVLLVDASERVVAHSVADTGGHFYGNSLAALEALLASRQIPREAIRGIVATGYGRKLFKEADQSVSEITANAAGAVGLDGVRIRTIINIGGQDSKVILTDDEGRVRHFVMNDRCAAGTGRFLEMAARIMGVAVADLGEHHLRAKGLPVTINSTCTVFAESEIISLLAGGQGKAEVIAGIHRSIARRVVRLAKKMTIEEPVCFDGGPALNRGLVAALEEELLCEVIVPGAPQITTALGAALIARRASTNGSS